MTAADRELDVLREAFASGADLPPSGDCVDPETLWEAAHGRLSREETAAVVDHIAACAACTEAARMARETQSRLAEHGSHQAPPKRWLVGGAAALAAAALFALVLTRDAGVPPPGAPTVARGGTEPPIQAVPHAESVLARNRPVLEWTGPAEALHYRVVVMTEELVAIDEARRLEEPTYRIPDAALEGLASGTKLLWQVEAQLSGGESVRSPTFIWKLE